MKQLEFFKETDKNQELLENAFDWAKEFPKLCDKESNFEDNFSEYFILFKPRDLVSDDFYWAKK